MKQWKDNDIKFLLDQKYFPECVECGNTYFHKKNCSRVTGKLSIEWSIINDRLNKRLEEFEKKHGENGCGIQCKECKNIATGEIHVLYHNSSSTVESWPVCMDHAFYEDSSGRESQYRGF